MMVVMPLLAGCGEDFARGVERYQSYSRQNCYRSASQPITHVPLADSIGDETDNSECAAAVPNVNRGS